MFKYQVDPELSSSPRFRIQGGWSERYGGTVSNIGQKISKKCQKIPEIFLSNPKKNLQKNHKKKHKIQKI